MNKLIKSVLTLAGSALFAVAAQAQDAAQPAQAQQPQQGQQQNETAQGRVQQVSAAQNQLTVKDQQGREHTFRLNREAQVRVNGQESNLAGLNQGDQVTVRFQLVGQEVQTRSGEENKNSRAISGQVRKVDAEQRRITIRDAQGKEQTVQVRQDARIRSGEQNQEIGQLKEGDNVLIRATQQGDQWQAQEVCSHRQGEQALIGQVRQVSAEQRQITVRDQQGRERTIRLSQDARTQVNGRQGNLSGVNQGDEVVVLLNAVVQEVRSDRQQPNRDR